MSKATCFVSSIPLCTSPRPTYLPRNGLSTISPTSLPSTPRQRRARVSMGLFGLGFPELMVIAGVGIFVFGPNKIAELGKDLGGIAGGVKKATAEFKEAMEESLEEADKEIEQRKAEKETASSKTVEASTKPVEDVSAS